MAESLEKLLEYSLQIGATDLILAEGLQPAVRMAGLVRAIPDAPGLSFGDLEKFLGNLDGENGMFRGGPWCGVEWRVRYSREAFGMMALLHPIGSLAPALNSLSVPDSVRSLLGAGSGLLLFSGPTSCGKTTTASAYVSELCSQRVLRAGFLDAFPEYGINEGMCLVHHRRKDVLLSDEIDQGIRFGTDLFWLGDLDTEFLIPALRAAESGALVVATVNAGSAKDVLSYLSAAEKMENKKLSRTLLAANLKAIVSEHLLLAQDGSCLIPAWEVLYNDTNVSQLIESGEYHRIPQAMRSAVSEGMLPLDDSLAELVREKRISRESARVYALDESRFV